MSTSISLFIEFVSPLESRRVGESDLQGIAGAVAEIPQLTEGLLFTPLEAAIDHPFSADGAGPVVALQLRFQDLLACEAAMTSDGIIAQLTSGSIIPGLQGPAGAHQVMVTRSYPVDKATLPDDATPCSYLVQYPGPAEDLHAWNRHYIEHHPPIMRTFRHVRQIEIYTRIDWIDRLPSRRIEYMQRNKIVFDNPKALEHALKSEVIKRMRADFDRFPPFNGGNKHYPMMTRIVRPTKSTNCL
jgi:hypothetical protein